MGGYGYWASFYICRVGVGAKAWLAAEEHLRQVAAGLSDLGEMRWGISTLVEHGLVIRCVARRGHQLFAGLRALWSAGKILLPGREAIPPRKMN